MKTIDVLLEQYLKYLTIDNSEKTMKTREGRLRLPIQAILRKEPRELTAELLADAMYAWAEGKKTSTVRSGLQEVKAFWRWMLLFKIISKKQWEDIWEEAPVALFMKQFPKRDQEVRPQYTVDEANDILLRLLPLVTSNPTGIESITLIALIGGLRIGEILNLQAKDLDNNCRVIRVGGTGSKKAKTEAGNRVVEVPDFFVPVLQSLKTGVPPNTKLFPLTYDQAYPRVIALQESLGLDALAFHALRRTNATLRVLGGQDPEAIERAFGHTDFKNMTCKHYVASGTVENQAQKRASQMLEETVTRSHLKLVSGGKD